MTYTIIASKSFRKSLKKYSRAGKHTVVEAVEEAAYLLSTHDQDSLAILVHQWRDHALKGDKKGTRELHLSLDDLLLYRIAHETGTINLLDIVNHEELRKKR